MVGGGIISLVEAAYQLDSSEEDWLRGIVSAIRPEIEDGFGALAYTYRAKSTLSLQRIVFDGVPGIEDPEMLKQALESTREEYVGETWRKLPFGLASDSETTKEQPAWPVLEAMGVREIVAINGVQPDGVGVWVGAMRTRVGGFDAKARKKWSRVGAHFATALRLRRRLERYARPSDATATADAVLEPGGKLTHAEGEAKTKSARDSLVRAAVELERSRGPLRRTDPNGALDGWKGLVDARWTLVDHFERDGKRYVLARRNDPDVPAIERLSLREKQVVGFVALGHSNKLIAYELGIAASTVGVLLSRAAGKLGAKSRAELAAIGELLLNDWQKS